MRSHVIAFAAEESRVSGGTVDLEEFQRRHTRGAQDITIAADSGL